MLSGMVDTLMLSSVGDQAVGAVGTANTYIGVFIIMYSVVSMGMLAVMTQNIGAGRPGIACQAKTLGLWFNGILGVVMSVFLFFCSEDHRKYSISTGFQCISVYQICDSSGFQGNVNKHQLLH
jgi:Na+-driven multidrug efflux pump